MDETATPQVEVDAEIVTPFHADLKTAASLGAKAEGAEIVWVDVPEDMREGLPARVPMELTRGANPAINPIAGDLESYRQHPARKTGQATVQTFEAFCALVTRHKTNASAIFCDADWTKPTLTAVIDYHEPTSGGRADNGKHRIFYPFPLSEEWKKWIEKNGRPMSHEDFSYFLEDRIPELSSPTDEEVIRFEQEFSTTVATPAKVVELSRNLRVNVGTKIKSMKTLQTGEGQISWEEEHTDDKGKPLKVPGIFVLAIAPFFMGEKIRIPVRLRYRPAGAGGVMWFYEIYRPDLEITQHVRATLADAREKTGLPTYEGAPEMTL